MGAHRQWGLHWLLAQDGLGAEWVDTYTRALAEPGAFVGGAGLVPGGHAVQPAGPTRVGDSRPVVPASVA
jgi:hypothetical protein